MSQLNEIYEGWKNLVFQSPEIEKEAKRRIEICASNECGNFTKLKVCALCGCYMPAKSRNMKMKCDINKW